MTSLMCSAKDLDPDPDLLDPQDFVFRDPDPQKYADIRILRFKILRF